ncbi:hypothetical protein GCM10025869_20220 [Homoserinibacter gongjuensis]|uniref:Uncharacterized protein n=1 Tax=Homoserinibacter gongjuensis TaxID=1162968 RepID=A0ABQ6JTL2_9MICO|nr:hypothetical protein GCM10025869_20220 [Homoserinibacter gongjuensis]
MRFAVEDVRYDFRDAAFEAGAVYSTLTGEQILDPSDAQVIYVGPTWGQLTYRFAESEGGWASIEVHSGFGHAQVGGAFVDSAVRDRWLDFHAAHARYGLATITEAARRTREPDTGWAP